MTGLIHVKVTAPGLGMWGIKILESLRILIKILSLVHYHGGLISDDYVIKIIINVLPGTSLASESGPGPGWLRVLDHKDPDDRPRALAWELGARPGPDCEAEPARVTAPTLSLLIISEKIGGNVLDLHRLQESQEAPCRSHNNSPSGLTLRRPPSINSSCLSVTRVVSCDTSRGTCAGENCVTCRVTGLRDRVTHCHDTSSDSHPRNFTLRTRTMQWNGSRYLQH